jgi:DNA-directed RNA polymerase specialized sigma subunit
MQTDLITKAKAGDQLAQAELYEKHFNIISYHRNKWRHKIPYSVYKDLISVINLCYCEALANYNPDKASFQTHLSRRIDWAVKQWIDDEVKQNVFNVNSGSAEFVPVRVNKFFDVRLELNKLTGRERAILEEQLLGKSYLEIAKYLHISKQRVGHIRASAVKRLKKRLK